MKNPRSFLREWVKGLAGLALLVCAINLFVDPYEVFGTPRIAGISLIKPITRSHAMLAKTFQVGRAHPVTVLIGSSPVHIGIAASALAWPIAMGRVYNYGIPGSNEISTSLHTLQEAVATGDVKNAVVFLDFQSFFSPGHPAPARLDDERPFRFMPDGAPNPDSRTQRAKDMLRSVGTMGAMIDSLKTVASQGRSNGLNLAIDGSGSEADFIAAARADGVNDLFARKDALEAERAEKAARVMAGWNGNLPGMDAVAAIIAFARAHDVKLTLVVAPHHVDALELYWRAGLWPRVEQLKAELATRAATQGPAVTLWDFLDYSSFNAEPVPRAGDRRTPTSWFWEPTHFKKQLGEVMIQRMFGTDAPMFGAELTPNTLAERNAQIRADRRVLVCERAGAVLTSLQTPPGDGCLRTDTPHGPTWASGRLGVSR